MWAGTMMIVMQSRRDGGTPGEKYRNRERVCETCTLTMRERFYLPLNIQPGGVGGDWSSFSSILRQQLAPSARSLPLVLSVPPVLPVPPVRLLVPIVPPVLPLPPVRFEASSPCALRVAYWLVSKPSSCGKHTKTER